MVTFLDVSLEKLHHHFPNVKEELLKVEITQSPSLLQKAHPNWKKAISFHFVQTKSI